MYQCSVCKKEYKNPLLASACKESHGLLYVPITKKDLNLLLKCIYDNDFSNIPEKLFNTLKQYSKLKDGNENDMSDL